MPKMVVLSQNGKELKEITLADSVFGIEPNQQCIFDAIVMQRASVRQGSIRATQWRGGGIVFGPTPRSYSYKLNKKVRRLALKSVLSEKVLENAMSVVDKFELAEPKTKAFNQIIADINAPKKTLFVVSENEDFENAFLSMRNIPTMMMLTADGINVYDIVNANKIVFTEAAVKDVEEALA